MISIGMDMMVIKEMMDMVDMEDMMETMDNMVITKVRLDLQGQGRLGGSAVQRWFLFVNQKKSHSNIS